jgi:hypothetical protein
MESFIVRVYRRSRTKPGEIAGLVETVGTDERRAFQSFAGLITALKHAVLRVEATPANRDIEQYTYASPDKKQAG